MTVMKIIIIIIIIIIIVTKFETNHLQYLIKWLYILFPGKKTYYHYTDQKGAEGIAKSEEIKASTDTKNDAVFGPGK